MGTSERNPRATRRCLCGFWPKEPVGIVREGKTSTTRLIAIRAPIRRVQAIYRLPRLEGREGFSGKRTLVRCRRIELGLLRMPGTGVAPGSSPVDSFKMRLT